MASAVNVIEITNYESFSRFTKNSQKCVLFYGRPTCSHCLHMIPVYEMLSHQYPNIRFAHINVEEVAVENKDNGVPIFVLYFKGVVIGKVIGADEDELVKELDELSSATKLLKSE